MKLFSLVIAVAYASSNDENEILKRNSRHYDLFRRAYGDYAKTKALGLAGIECARCYAFVKSTSLKTTTNLFKWIDSEEGDKVAKQVSELFDQVPEGLWDAQPKGSSQLYHTMLLLYLDLIPANGEKILRGWEQDDLIELVQSLFFFPQLKGQLPECENLMEQLSSWFYQVYFELKIPGAMAQLAAKKELYRHLRLTQSEGGIMVAAIKQADQSEAKDYLTVFSDKPAHEIIRWLLRKDLIKPTACPYPIKISPFFFAGTEQDQKKIMELLKGRSLSDLLGRWEAFLRDAPTLTAAQILSTIDEFDKIGLMESIASGENYGSLLDPSQRINRYLNPPDQPAEADRIRHHFLFRAISPEWLMQTTQYCQSQNNTLDICRYIRATLHNVLLLARGFRRGALKLAPQPALSASVANLYFGFSGFGMGEPNINPVDFLLNSILRIKDEDCPIEAQKLDELLEGLLLFSTVASLSSLKVSIYQALIENLALGQRVFLPALSGHVCFEICHLSEDSYEIVQFKTGEVADDDGLYSATFLISHHKLLEAGFFEELDFGKLGTPKIETIGARNDSGTLLYLTKRILGQASHTWFRAWLLLYNLESMKDDHPLEEFELRFQVSRECQSTCRLPQTKGLLKAVVRYAVLTLLRDCTASVKTLLDKIVTRQAKEDPNLWNCYKCLNFKEEHAHDDQTLRLAYGDRSRQAATKIIDRHYLNHYFSDPSTWTVPLDGNWEQSEWKSFATFIKWLESPEGQEVMQQRRRIINSIPIEAWDVPSHDEYYHLMLLYLINEGGNLHLSWLLDRTDSRILNSLTGFSDLLNLFSECNKLASQLSYWYIQIYLEILHPGTMALMAPILKPDRFLTISQDYKLHVFERADHGQYQVRQSSPINKQNAEMEIPALLLPFIDGLNTCPYPLVRSPYFLSAPDESDFKDLKECILQLRDYPSRLFEEITQKIERWNRLIGIQAPAWDARTFSEHLRLVIPTLQRLQAWRSLQNIQGFLAGNELDKDGALTIMEIYAHDLPREEEWKRFKADESKLERLLSDPLFVAISTVEFVKKIKPAISSDTVRPLRAALATLLYQLGEYERDALVNLQRQVQEPLEAKLLLLQYGDAILATLPDNVQEDLAGSKANVSSRMMIGSLLRLSGNLPPSSPITQTKLNSLLSLLFLYNAAAESYNQGIPMNAALIKRLTTGQRVFLPGGTRRHGIALEVLKSEDGYVVTLLNSGGGLVNHAKRVFRKQTIGGHDQGTEEWRYLYYVKFKATWEEMEKDTSSPPMRFITRRLAPSLSRSMASWKFQIFWISIQFRRKKLELAPSKQLCT